MTLVKYRMDVEYSEAKKPKTDTRYVDSHKKTYGFKTEEERSAYRMGIEAVSYVYDFEINVKEYEEN